MTIEYRCDRLRLRHGEEEEEAGDDLDDAEEDERCGFIVEHLKCIQRITVDVLVMTSSVSMMTGAHKLRAKKSGVARGRAGSRTMAQLKT